MGEKVHFYCQHKPSNEEILQLMCCKCIPVQRGLFEDAAVACCVAERRAVGCSVKRLVIRGVGEAICEKGRFVAAGFGS